MRLPNALIEIIEISTPPNPIPGSAAVVGYGNDADRIVLQAVNRE